MNSLDCRASKILFNDIKLESISWELDIVNSFHLLRGRHFYYRFRAIRKRNIRLRNPEIEKLFFIVCKVK